jgi:hypothetical protein
MKEVAMQSTGKRHFRTAIVIVTPLVVIAVLAGIFIVRPTMIAQRDNRRRFVHLLCEADHERLLAGCRELSARVDQGGLEPGTYAVRRGEMAPEAKEFPSVILDVEPTSVLVEDSTGRVVIDLYGFPCYGVVAYPAGHDKGAHDLGDVELVPGLWYFHEDYDKYEDYREDVNALLARRRIGG